MLLRMEGEQVKPGDALAPDGAAAILLISMNVAPEHEHEFNEWYNTEHLDALAGMPGVLRARRYRGSSAKQRYAAVYHFANPEVPNSAAWKTAANTPWTEKMRKHFQDYLRIDARAYKRA
jgi:antibiotic biosynthesis monooxygenase (ABM) superfamily enzyme